MAKKIIKIIDDFDVDDIDVPSFGGGGMDAGATGGSGGGFTGGSDRSGGGFTGGSDGSGGGFTGGSDGSGGGSGGSGGSDGSGGGSGGSGGSDGSVGGLGGVNVTDVAAGLNDGISGVAGGLGVDSPIDGDDDDDYVDDEVLESVPTTEVPFTTPPADPTKIIFDSELSYTNTLSTNKGPIPPSVPWNGYFFSPSRRETNGIVCSNNPNSDVLRQLLGSMYMANAFLETSGDWYRGSGAPAGFTLYRAPDATSLQLSEQIGKCIPVRKFELANLMARDDRQLLYGRIFSDLEDEDFDPPDSFESAADDFLGLVGISTGDVTEQVLDGATVLLSPSWDNEKYSVKLNSFIATFDLALFAPRVEGSDIPLYEYFKSMFKKQTNPRDEHVPSLADRYAYARLTEEEKFRERDDNIAENSKIRIAINNFMEFANEFLNLSSLATVSSLDHGQFEYLRDTPKLYFDHTFKYEEIFTEHLIFDIKLKFNKFLENYCRGTDSPAGRRSTFRNIYLPNAYSFLSATNHIIADDAPSDVPILGGAGNNAFSLKNLVLLPDVPYRGDAHEFLNLLNSITGIRNPTDEYFSLYGSYIKGLGTQEANLLAADGRAARGPSLNRLSQIIYNVDRRDEINEYTEDLKTIFPFINTLQISNRVQGDPLEFSSAGLHFAIHSNSNIRKFLTNVNPYVRTPAPPHQRIGLNIFKLINYFLGDYVTPMTLELRNNALTLQGKKDFLTFFNNKFVNLKDTKYLDLQKVFKYYRSIARDDDYDKHSLFSSLASAASGAPEGGVVATLRGARSRFEDALTVDILSAKLARPIKTRYADPDNFPRADFKVLDKKITERINSDFKDRGWLEALRGTPSKTTVLAYKILKTRSSDQSIQEIIIPASTSAEDTYDYLDSQIDFNERFSYELKLLVLVNGIQYYYRTPRARYIRTYDPTNPFISTTNRDREHVYQLHMDVVSAPSAKIIEIPLNDITADGRYKKTNIPVDKPPTSPVAEFLPFKDTNNKIRMILSPNPGKEIASPIGINRGDQERFNAVENAHGPFGDEGFEFESTGEPFAYQLFRVDFEPTSYTDFAGTERAVNLEFTEPGGLEPKRTSVGVFDDRITPDKKYYYCFRTLNESGFFSNPSQIFEVQLVSIEAAVLPRIRVFEFRQPEKQPERKFRRFIKIKPSTIQEALSDREFRADGDPSRPYLSSGEVEGLSFVRDDNSVFGKKMRAEITSNKTGRKIFIDFKFTNKLNKDIILTGTE